jgi:hypothetical protein
MVYKIVDKESPRFGQVGTYDSQRVTPGSNPELHYHRIQFEDGKMEEFLSYQIEKQDTLQRRFEVLYKENTCSRLTVTISRVTLKIKPGHEGIKDDLEEISNKIVEFIGNYDRTLRGTFNWDNRSIRMSNKSGEAWATFTLDGRTGEYIVEKQ